MSNPKDLAAQSVEIAEDGSASLAVQTTDGEKFSCPLEKVEEEAGEAGAEGKPDAEADKAPTDPAAPANGEGKGEDTPPAV